MILPVMIKEMHSMTTETATRPTEQPTGPLSVFTAHPASVNETYFEHMGVALSFSAKLLFAGSVCLVHALLPFLFEKTGSRQVENLHQIMVANRIRNQA